MSYFRFNSFAHLCFSISSWLDRSAPPPPLRLPRPLKRQEASQLGRRGRSARRATNIAARSRDDAYKRDALDLPPEARETRAHLALLETPGEDDASFWGPAPAFEGAHPPHVAKPTTPLQQGMEEVDEEDAMPRAGVFDLSPVRTPLRDRRGAPSLAAVRTLEVADLIEERQYESEKERRLFARLPKLDESPKTHAEVETFLATLESEADRAGATKRFYDFVLSQLSVAALASFTRCSRVSRPANWRVTCSRRSRRSNLETSVFGRCADS